MKAEARKTIGLSQNYRILTVEYIIVPRTLIYTGRPIDV